MIKNKLVFAKIKETAIVIGLEEARARSRDFKDLRVLVLTGLKNGFDIDNFEGDPYDEDDVFNWDFIHHGFEQLSIAIFNEVGCSFSQCFNYDRSMNIMVSGIMSYKGITKNDTDWYDVIVADEDIRSLFFGVL